jgi:type VI secretion system protein ImpJ
MYLELDDGDAATPPARPLDKHLAPTQTVLDVFLGVLREREGVANLPEREGSSRPTRFSVATRQVLDTASGTNDEPIQFAQPRVTILFGGEPREDYEAIKIAEVVRDTQGAFVVSDSYIPPALRLAASPPLVERLEAILALTVAKQRTLLEGRRQRDGVAVEFTGADVTRYLLLSAVSEFIPVLHHVIESADLAPRGVYLLLAQFTGALAPFSPECEAVTLPAFSHTDLRASFEGVLTRLTAQLGQVVKENFISVPLQPRPDGGHLGRLDDERVLRAREFVLSVKSHLPESQTIERLPGLSKIASWADINKIVQGALPGVPVTVTHRPPPEIPVRAGHVYFTLAVSSSELWRNVLQERRLAVWLPSPFLPNETQLQLLCVPQPAPEPGR